MADSQPYPICLCPDTAHPVRLPRCIADLHSLAPILQLLPLPTPPGSLQGEELTEVILKLLWAWRDPLWHFHQSMAHHDDFNSFSSNKALVMGDLVHELRTGVEKVAEKVRAPLY